MADRDQLFALQFRATAGGQAVRNTFHVRQNPTAGHVDAAHLQALLADANTTTLINAYKGILRTSDTLDVVLARGVEDPLDPSFVPVEAALVLNAAGTRAVPAAGGPTGLSMVVGLYTDTSGRRYMGRFWPPPPIDQTAFSGTVISTGHVYYTAVNAFVTQLVKTTYPSGAGHYGGAWNDNDLAVWSRRAASIPADPQYARVTDIQPKLQVHYLRSREARQ
jgi:hypothetical protein